MVDEIINWNTIKKYLQSFGHIFHTYKKEKNNKTKDGYAYIYIHIWIINWTLEF